MGAQQANTKGGGNAPFKGVPSDQVGRGSGMDPPDELPDDREENAVIKTLREEAKEEGREPYNPAAPRGQRNEGASDASAEDAKSDIGSVQRPPSDS